MELCLQDLGPKTLSQEVCEEVCGSCRCLKKAFMIYGFHVNSPSFPPKYVSVVNPGMAAQCFCTDLQSAFVYLPVLQASK